MIKGTTLAGVVALLLLGTAKADPIVVRSGDHNGFTRLVLRLPDDASWQLAEEAGLTTITVTGHEEGFDISRVFDIIPRDYLVDVRQYPSRLELIVSCACEFTTFVERNQFLVVDIVDGPPLPTSRETQAARFISARPASGFNFGDLLWSQFSSTEDENVTTETVQPTPVDEVNLPSQDRSAETALIEQTRQQLLTGLSAAASRGVVQPSTPDLDNLIARPEVPKPTDIFDSSEEVVPSVVPETSNIRISSSRDTPNAAQDIDLMTSGAVCPAPDNVLVPNWGGSDPFHLQVAQLRSALFSEIDRIDKDTAVRLARLYIYFGFGAEAKQVLDLSDELALSHPELIDLAEIMEHGFARNPRFVYRFSDCNSELALWAAMAAKDLPADQILNEAAALRALAALPDHLKSFIAPALSRRLSDRGSLDSAAIALRNVEWTELRNDNTTDLAKAEIETQSGNAEVAKELLEGVMQESVAETPEAMIAFVDNRLAEGKNVPADVALLIETYAFEWRESPLAKDLQRAHVIASAYSGQFTKAFEATRAAVVEDDPQLLAELQGHIFTALSSDAEDITFLDAFFSEYPDRPNTQSKKSVEATASRLLDLGFASEAEAILADLDAGQANDALRLLHARALLALRQPEAAMTVLSLVQGDRSTALRAEALSQLGENKDAFELFQSLNAEQDATRSAWLANEWTELVPQDAPLFGEARALSGETMPTVAPREGMLETIGSAITQSDSARATLEQLLNGLPVNP